MSEPKTPNLGLNTIDRSTPSTTYFDLDKYLDQNWEKIDDFAEQMGNKAEETATKVSDIQERLDVAKRADITLQPGLQIVNATQDAAFKLTGLQGKTELNYHGQIGIYGVLNPYVIRYGENLLPPFYEWSNLGSSKSINSLYSITINNPSVGDDVAVYFKCEEGDTFTLSVEHDGRIGVNAWDINGNTVGTNSVVPYTANQSVTFTMPAGTVRGSLHFGNIAGADQILSTCSFVNPMLNIGNTALPFVPREDSLLALQTELHAHPDTGANPDIVFERDGQYFKLAKWNKLTLNGKLSYSFYSFGNDSGFKRIRVDSFPAYNAVNWNPVGTKFNGTRLSRGNIEVADALYGSPDGSLIAINISNVDSGWGESYIPTADEIKAYFLGWRMANSGDWSPYNGTGSKAWKNILRYQDAEGETSYSLPTTKVPNWTPYQLLYQLATPVVEPITSQGQLTFNQGRNQVEVGTGIVLQESAPAATRDSYGRWNIGNKYAGPGAEEFKNKSKLVLNVYKNGKLDPMWYKFSAAQELILGVSYDPSAAYSVTYLMSDQYPVSDIIGTYAENEKAMLLDTVKMLKENTTRISVLENKKAEKDTPAWITPTLVNGWAQYPGYPTVQYVKDSSENVHIRGLIQGGLRDPGKRIFVLPQGFRPKTRRIFNVLSSETRITAVGTTIEITEDGNVYLGTSASEKWLNLEGISFNINL
ncbi:hypothetical protein PAECIP112173_03400 [Paenibacillus sp. JJ-100]|uniref:hypothetical protein n=1 Tax=Paenibacillus sp. JJ-100 TaxID=2974896 RepID=UPI0022FF95FE|nr:hypothetical protein [Paenibacillus sp. JJ-100]CAI6082009.1 hypothetical protein PAECIP112173_03400 [Paenibacillus sp. JJ-100]